MCNIKTDVNNRLVETFDKAFYNINKILTGEKSMEYLDKILFHLNGDINKYFLTSDAKSYAQHTYKVDYTKLPDSGAGLTKERIVYNRRKRKLFPFIEEIRMKMVDKLNESENYFVVDSLPLASIKW
jgi:hypothetical protein